MTTLNTGELLLF